GLLNGVSVPSTTTMDWYAGYAHYYAYAPNAGLPGLIYGFADDDECSLPNGNGAGQYEAATSRVYQSGDQWSVVLNPY
ncbi:MAG TPA: hypothetical protein VFN49_12595, partial [Candidatus Aquilonibacter sp.]|nr:hypothetical protein [Candidatus Aquilonibacter sp.]